MITQDQIVNVLVYLAMGVGAIVLLALLTLAGGVLAGSFKWARRQFVAADAALVPFGRTPFGAMLNAYVAGLIGRVDEANDPLVQQVTDVLITGLLALVPKYGARLKAYVTPELVSQVLREIALNLEQLTDGETIKGA